MALYCSTCAFYLWFVCLFVNKSILCANMKQVVFDTVQNGLRTGFNNVVKRLMVVEIRDNFINAVSEGENDIRKHWLCLSPNQTAPFQTEKNVWELIKFCFLL